LPNSTTQFLGNMQWTSTTFFRRFLETTFSHSIQSTSETLKNDSPYSSRLVGQKLLDHHLCFFLLAHLEYRPIPHSPLASTPSSILNTTLKSKENNNILPFKQDKMGYRLARKFTLKEAYHLYSHYSDLPKEDIWKKLWKSNIWPKVATFL
jgi:hypothetical protein